MSEKIGYVLFSTAAELDMAKYCKIHAYNPATGSESVQENNRNTMGMQYTQ